LQHDCLQFLHYQGKPVKASRLFAGNEHEEQVKRIAEYFNEGIAQYKTIEFDARLVSELERKIAPIETSDTKALINESLFAKRNLADFASGEEAYHQLMMDIIAQQKASTQLVLQGTDVKRIFVDGGFSKNSAYMHLLAKAFPGQEVFAASMAQATSLGTALAIHQEWNEKPLPTDIIDLKYYAFPKN
jgi:hypothetical protein